MPLLEVQNISHSFDYPLFEDINFSLMPSESMSITGVSGSGKSTLLNICSTLLKPNHGTVKLFDQDIYNLPTKELIALRRKKLGIIFQSHYLFKGFNAFENIELSTLMVDAKIDEELLERFQIKKAIHQKVGELSGGQQQRVSIARVLSKKPRIIFADEPTGNLDHKTASEVMDILFDYIKMVDGVLLMVTHDDDLAQKCKFHKHLNQEGLL
ncbi:ABC transporter ATP-binding protein [Sulfurospirillum sp. 1612]|uniref:ABC transporter ATP-binding protein n=1 Tax=Sulfurospirillum sp. 1612 TaxID=3094835 RepID=UPI002F936328